MSSTLDPDNTFEPDRRLGLGHGNAALGPSDTSDSGSDFAGGLAEELGMRPPRPLADVDEEEAALLDRSEEWNSDTDAAGTGERASAGPIDIQPGRDINVDRIDRIDAEGLFDEETAEPKRNAG